MSKYILKRLVQTIPVLLGAVIVVFTINFFSKTDPAMVKLGSYASDAVRLEEMRESMGLNRPYIVQLGEYIWNLLHGDLGHSYIYSKTVAELMADRIPNTIKLSIASMVLSTIIGVPLGLYAALHQNSAVDYATTTIAVIFNAVPGFLLAVILMLVFGLKLGWLPIAGVDTWKHFILPTVASSFMPMTVNVRMTRSAVLDVIRQDYVRTARSKGIDEGQVIRRHVMKNAMIPVLTIIGTGLSTCISGSVLVEMIFNIPGMGSLINQSVMQKDFITVQGCAVICALVVSLANLITDLAYAFVDPRIKAQYAGGREKKHDKAKAAEATAV